MGSLPEAAMGPSSVLLAVCAAAAFIPSAKGQSELKPQLESCIGDGLSLSSCLTALAEVHLSGYMSNGLPDLGGAQAIDPMSIEDITEELKTPLGNLEVKFRNIKVTDLSSHTIESVVVSPTTKTYTLKLFNPSSRSQGQYQMNGRVGPLDLGENNSWENYVTEFVNAEVKVTADINVDGNNRITSVGAPSIEQNIQEIKPMLDNLFGGEAESLAKVVTKFISKQGQTFLKEFQPKIAEIISVFFKTILNNLLVGVELTD